MWQCASSSWGSMARRPASADRLLAQSPLYAFNCSRHSVQGIRASSQIMSLLQRGAGPAQRWKSFLPLNELSFVS